MKNEVMDPVRNRPFALPVDSEHKATTIRLWSCAQPHMAAFHLSWIAFMTPFFSTFAPAALIPSIREDLGMTKDDIGNAGIAAVVGAVGARIFMGSILDTYGPRFGYSAVLLLTSTPVFCLALAGDTRDFICLRFFVGLSLSAFVCCQFWCSSMFNTRIVGTANAVAAGWGNLGGGLCHLVMPNLAHGIAQYVPEFQAWRLSFFLPGAMHVVIGAVVLLFGQDLPDGDYRELRKAGLMDKPKAWKTLYYAVINYRTWVMLILYGYCFGVELTVDNVITTYLFDQFALDLHTAGMFGSIFGLMNLFTRACGGLGSDVVAHYTGMRGRLWLHWVIQTLGGVFCILLAYQKDSLNSTVGMLVVFSIFCQAACGSTYGIVPFISKRSLGLVSGFVGAGGNFGSALTQALYFKLYDFTTDEGFRFMGVHIMAVTMLLFLIYFPMWGGMLFPARQGVSEEDYYLAEYTPEEIAQGLAAPSVRFANESKSQRGKARDATDASMRGAKTFDQIPAETTPVAAKA